MDAWNATVVDEGAPARLQQLTEADLPEGDVTVAVRWSSLNFKDGLAVTGRGKVVQRNADRVRVSTWPAPSRSSVLADWRPGDEVLATGWGSGSPTPAGTRAANACPADWLLARPDGLTLSQTMAIGTAGLTAMLAADLETGGRAG